MARACFSAYAKSAQPRACRSACTMRAHMVRTKLGACRFSMLIGAGMAARRACAPEKHASDHMRSKEQWSRLICQHAQNKQLHPSNQDKFVL